MKHFVLITAIIELVAGAGLFIAPGMIPDLQGESAMALSMARMYGAAAFAFGYYALLVWRQFNTGPVQGFLKTFLVFHIGVTVASYVGYSQGIPTLVVVTALHGLLAIATLYFLNRIRA